MSNITRFLADRYCLYDYQVRFLEELERRKDMAKVNDEILVKCNGAREIAISPTSLHFYQSPDINTGGYEIEIACVDYTIYDSGRAPGVSDIKKVIFSDPCTIVLWDDGTKTIVRCTDEKFDKEKGFAMCIAKKALGNKGKYYDVFKKWIEEDKK